MFVATFLAVMAAFGTTAPVASETLPVMVAKVVCGWAALANSSMTAPALNSRLSVDMKHLRGWLSNPLLFVGYIQAAPAGPAHPNELWSQYKWVAAIRIGFLLAFYKVLHHKNAGRPPGKETSILISVFSMDSLDP